MNSRIDENQLKDNTKQMRIREDSLRTSFIVYCFKFGNFHFGSA